jgi:lipopolysaccharide transport system ATP-binding protein
VAQGRIAALLQLGAGFNREFSGRENVFLNAALMGLDRRETEERFDEIVAFSELADYIDRPLRTYSSGMFVRLAFSVAINVEPSILVIDEALAVGDEAFQRKCYARIQQFQAQGGTILFVSHSSGAVIELCSRAILLDNGEMLFSGLPRDVIAQYQKLLYAPPEQVADLRARLRAKGERSTEKQSGGPPVVPSAGLPQPAAEEPALYDPGMVPRSTLRYDHRGAHIHDARILSAAGDRVNLLVQRNDYVFTYRVRFERAADRTRFGMLIKTTSGYELGGATSAEIGRGEDIPHSGSIVEVRFQFKCLLTPGTYFVNAGVVGQVDGAEVFLDRWIDFVMFKVMPGRYPLATGSVDLLIEPSLAIRTATEPLPE